MANKIRIGGHTLEVSNIDKVFFPQDGITKGDLIDYYQNIGNVMVPYLKDRPLSMHRFPDGIEKEGFFQQEIGDYYPDWMERVTLKKEGGSITHVLCQNTATLVYLANQACITPHIWLSRKDRLEYPDQIIFDLDPPGNDFAPVREAALLLRTFLKDLGLATFVKTTGSRGLHVLVPLDRSADFSAVHNFAHNAVNVLAQHESAKLTGEQRKEKRDGRIFLDYMRNSYGQTAVAPYAVRAKPGAPVATPLYWDELSDRKLQSQSYTIKNVSQRLAETGDPWNGLWRKPHSLDSAIRKLQSMKPKG